MFLTITTTHEPATDLGYLLYKNPARAQSFDLSFGKAHVFYPEATAERCTRIAAARKYCLRGPRCSARCPATIPQLEADRPASRVQVMVARPAPQSWSTDSGRGPLA